MANSSSARADFGEHIGFIWSIAELLRGNYKQSEYGKGGAAVHDFATARLRVGADERRCADAVGKSA